MLNIGFIGAGTTGTALASRLDQQGFMVRAVASHSLTSARRLAGRLENCKVYNTPQEVSDNAHLVFITTPDDVIATVVNSVKWHERQYIVHCSGTHSLDIIDAAKKYGAISGAFHPLQTFADIEQAFNNLPGSTFAIEAGEPLLATLKEMAIALKCDCVLLQAGDKALYHTAAVFSCNYLVTLVKLATDLWSDFGVDQGTAIRAMLPLLRGTLQNIQNIGLPNCLTGPIARGDLGTIQKHISTLEKENPDVLGCYKLLGHHTIPIALAKGKIDAEGATQMEKILST
ncbi:MAG TPA: DUF2520 domain-containing protein [Dehalococcoidia bacterium]|nr:DUF2520 domain-containing protein [Dehalococcoidia bacterium]